ncbi:MAG: response regulator [Armatimonadetes bacterium]|nr:response regulator [Armatimonadota bacterium]
MEALRIVIADDEAIIRLDLKESLQRLGHTVVGEAGDGRRAVELAQDLRPDLVILDIRMPELDGIDAAKQLAADRVAPVLLLTAYSQRDLVERAMDAGVFAYVVKPFTEADLLPAMGVAIARFREFRQISDQAASLQEAMETRKLVDRAKGMLMDRHGLTEAEAFRRIQQQSMNTRRSMREIAEAIMIAHEVGSAPPRRSTGRKS